MKSSTKVLAPGIYLYENAVEFTKTISDLSLSDLKNWNISNQDAIEWKPGDKFISYDEYPINFNFSINESLLLMGKKVFDSVTNYATKNLTSISGFDYCAIRKYSTSPGFLALESSDVDNVSRKITAALFLDTITQGGQLTFKNFDVSVTPQQGSIVIFPASFAYSFKINKPKDSDSLIVISHFV